MENVDNKIEENPIDANSINNPSSKETYRKKSVLDRFKLINLSRGQKIADVILIGFFVIICVGYPEIETIEMLVPLVVPILFGINKWLRPKNAIYFGLLLFVLLMFVDDIETGMGSIVVVLPIVALIHHFTKPKWHGSVANMSGTEFEYWCAALLKKNMRFISAKVTSASNDYGADIIGIDSRGRKWVIQCKRYGGSVSNSAVQEVVAAKAHYNAEKAAVMTNSRLTKNARKLADENGVEVFENLGD